MNQRPTTFFIGFLHQLHKYQALSTNQLHLCIKIIELQYNKKTHHKLIQCERIDFGYVMNRINKYNT